MLSSTTSSPSPCRTLATVGSLSSSVSCLTLLGISGNIAAVTPIKAKLPPTLYTSSKQWRTHFAQGQDACQDGIGAIFFSRHASALSQLPRKLAGLPTLTQHFAASSTGTPNNVSSNAQSVLSCMRGFMATRIANFPFFQPSFLATYFAFIKSMRLLTTRVVRLLRS